MKRLVLLTLLIPFLFASCNKEPEMEPVLTISHSSIDAPAEGSSTTIKLLCNNKWTVSAPDWCTVSPSGGEGNEKEVQVTVTVKENAAYDGRSGSITFKSGDLTATLNVKQEADTGVVLPKNEYNISSDAQQLEVTVQASSPVQYEVAAEGKEWISIVETKALEDYVLTIAIEENSGYEPRKSEVYVRLERSNDYETISIVQQAKDTLYVEEKLYNVVKDGGTIEVKVKSTVDYDVEIKDSWISSTDTKALAENTHSFVVAANSEVQGRNGYIAFKSKTTNYTCISLPF